MKTNPSTVYRWVMAAMDRITAEPARRVLDLEFVSPRSALGA
jgi:hypothetical protein